MSTDTFDDLKQPRQDCCRQPNDWSDIWHWYKETQHTSCSLKRIESPVKQSWSYRKFNIYVRLTKDEFAHRCRRATRDGGGYPAGLFVLVHCSR